MENEIVSNHDNGAKKLRDTIGDIVAGSGYGSILNKPHISRPSIPKGILKENPVPKLSDVEDLMISKKNVTDIINERIEIYNKAIALSEDPNNETKASPEACLQWRNSSYELQSLLTEIDKL